MTTRNAAVAPPGDEPVDMRTRPAPSRSLIVSLVAAGCLAIVRRRLSGARRVSVRDRRAHQGEGRLPRPDLRGRDVRRQGEGLLQGGGPGRRIRQDRLGRPARRPRPRPVRRELHADHVPAQADRAGPRREDHRRRPHGMPAGPGRREVGRSRRWRTSGASRSASRRWAARRSSSPAASWPPRAWTRRRTSTGWWSPRR